MKYKIVKDKKDKRESGKQNEDNVILMEKSRWNLNEIALSRNTMEQIKEMLAYIPNKKSCWTNGNSVVY